MKKATVTYSAPKGDSKVIEMLGQTFYDGQPGELICEEVNLERLKGNKLFKIGNVVDYDPDKEASKDQPKTEAHKR